MKTAHAIVLSLSTFVCGAIVEREFSNFLAAKAAEIARQTNVAEFAINLKSDATILALLKRNRLECAQVHLEKRVKAMIDVADSYRDLADESGKGMLDRAVALGSEQLRAPRLVNADDPKTCF